MHELPITESILEIALRHAQAANASHITNIYLVIGQLASVVDESVQFYWDIVARGTLAEGATLHFRRIPTTLNCSQCEHQYQPSGSDFACPLCDCTRFTVVSGQEFYVEAIDVEK